MDLKYCATYWGCEGMQPEHFLDIALLSGYQGVEINLASGDFDNDDFRMKLYGVREDHHLSFIAQQVLDGRTESVSDYIGRMEERFRLLSDFRPDFINSHTGKDFFSFDDNCRAIEAAENFSAKSGIPVCHETHRGRFTFHLPTLIPYLEKFPQMRLTGDFSHWCCVSESLLQEQADAMKEVLPHIHHLHARVGFEQGPQVGNPFSTQWEDHLSVYTAWWEDVIRFRKAAGSPIFTITPEAGPAPYMPLDGNRPVADNWELNLQMKHFLTETFTDER